MSYLTKHQFKALNPVARGYVTAMAGQLAEEPNVPDQGNPFPKGSKLRELWDKGRNMAIRQAERQDKERSRV